MHKIYSNQEIDQLLDNFLSLDWDAETERLEFKDANDNFSTQDIGKYFSAISNETNLHNKEYGRLIFGVENKTKKIIGTTYRQDSDRLNSLKHTIQQNCPLTFVQIYEHRRDWKRLIMFQIPPAIPWIVTEYDNHAYWRNGQSLVGLNEYKRETIKSQKIEKDRTAWYLDWFTLDDIDPEALFIAMDWYKLKHPDISIDDWDVWTFLKKSRMIRDDKFTRACGLLLGKDESISQHFPRLEMSRILKDKEGNVIAHEHFKSPFIVSANAILSRVRILPQRFLPEWTLMPVDIPSYDERVLRELLANAICHQDYRKQWRIGIQEFPEYLIISNVWSFYSWSIQKVIEQEDFMPSSYRNPCLKDSMSEIKMIEYAWSGLRKVFMKQKERYMPMPEDISTKDEVKIRIDGKIIDENYTKLLYHNHNLSLMDIVHLDKVQKNRKLPEEMIKSLKIRKLIEWRKPHYYISLSVAQKTDQVGGYFDAKWLEIHYQKEMIEKYMQACKHPVEKQKIIEFMRNKLEKTLSEKQITNRITNLLEKLKHEWKVKNTGMWRYVKRQII